MYNYEEQKKSLFTERGQVVFLKIRDHVKKLLQVSGSCTMEKAISCATGDGWHMLACVDRLVELNEIKEIPTNGMAQERIFIQK